MLLKYTYASRTGKYAPRRHHDLENVPLNDTLKNIKGSLLKSEYELRKSLGGAEDVDLMPPESENEPVVMHEKFKKSAKRPALGDISNSQRAPANLNAKKTVETTSMPYAKQVVAKIVPLKKAVEAPSTQDINPPSIQSSPLLFSNGRPLIQRTPPAPLPVTIRTKATKSPTVKKLGKAGSKKIKSVKKGVLGKKSKKVKVPDANPSKKKAKVSDANPAKTLKLKVTVPQSLHVITDKPQLRDLSVKIHPEDIGSTLWVRKL